jgi:hypothetical protein
VLERRHEGQRVAGQDEHERQVLPALDIHALQCGACSHRAVCAA